MAASPTQLSLKMLRENGYYAEVVERYNSFTKQRKDLFGFADIIAIRTGEVLLVQTTTRSNEAARVRKIALSEVAPLARSAGMKIEVHGWRKIKGKWAVNVTAC